ncbi:hypothetical protein [Microlunatus speluncae]|uniref:hypothetical protein n=1 Tax=Microlunatus speluncae TaxID=2594267 RepID=UPI001FE83125|nr:hypothetical protein [Microlunatus speluncae]
MTTREIMTTLELNAENRAAIDWLLSSDEPAIRYLARRDLLGTEAAPDESAILAGSMITTLLAGQREDGVFPGEGWSSTLWRLVALVELAIPPDEPRAIAAADWYLDRVLGKPHHRGRPTIIDGLHRFCSNGEGHALVIGARLGLADDPRLRRIADSLIEWQWPDGGWNCHRNASGRRSSFQESLAAAWGLHEYAAATGDSAAAAAADRTAELYLQHRLVYSLGSGRPSRRFPHPVPAGQVIDQRWIKLGYPAYWHYDILASMIFLTRIGRITDPRAAGGLDLLEQRRRPDGRWAADRQWWVKPGHRFTHQYDVVDWGVAGEPSELITLNALRILRGAGRLD